MSNDVFHGIRAASAVDALSIAAANGKLREMNLLLQDGIAINARATYSGRNPLQSAALQGQTRALEAGARSGIARNQTPMPRAVSTRGSKRNPVDTAPLCDDYAV